jgi:hypothetical protein
MAVRFKKVPPLKRTPKLKVDPASIIEQEPDVSKKLEMVYVAFGRDAQIEVAEYYMLCYQNRGEIFREYQPGGVVAANRICREYRASGRVIPGLQDRLDDRYFRQFGKLPRPLILAA